MIAGFIKITFVVTWHFLEQDIISHIEFYIDQLSNCGSAIAHLQGCSCPRILFQNIWLKMQTSASLCQMHILDYFIGESQALQMIVFLCLVP